MAEKYTVRVLAGKAGINIETVRYYEKIGLMPVPRRTPGGYRIYDDEDLKRLHFIALAKRHGFLLNEIRDLLNLRADVDTTCSEVRRKAEEKVAVIREKIRELEQMETALNHLINTCRETNSERDCPILEAFETE